MSSRIEKRNDKKKSKKLLWKSLLFIFSLVILVIAYSVYQYYEGLNEAGESEVVNIKNEKVEFKGIKDEMGRINVLLLGVDSRGEEQSRTDTIMIAQYNPKNGESKIVSIMRDIYAEIPGKQNYKINTAYFLGGPELLRKTIKQNFDIDIEYYAVVDFQGFEKMVDTLAPGGIEIDVEKKMSSFLHVELQSGLQRLNGKELLEYARFRHDAEGDFGRVRRQQQVINTLKSELLGLYGITKLPKLTGTIQPYVETNMDTMDRLAIARDFILNPPDDIKTLRIPVDNSYEMADYEHAGSVIEIDKEKNSKALKDFLNGSTLDAQEKATEETKNE
ncbi:LCP family protein [Bacillus sp. DJP31]|uniref:LCP family protein n=1 Tax=Bacillus sp. DJP31 TaxID=3409789 RepID=UPI003BB6E6BB